MTSELLLGVFVDSVGKQDNLQEAVSTLFVPQGVG